MKQFLISYFLLVAIVILFSILPQISYAQIGNPDLIDPDTPIDGGLGVLVAVGVAYGIKKIGYERKMNKEK